MNLLLRPLPLFRAAALLAALSAGCSRQPERAAEVIRPVRTALVVAGEDSSTRVFPGRVEASKQAELAFQVSGLLASLPAREGQKVAQGDVIAQLRQEEFRARLDALRGQLDRARANLEALRAGARPEERLRLEAQLRSADATLANARTDLDRATRLLRSQTISRLEYDRAETAYRVAAEQREASRQTLEQSLTAREEDLRAAESGVRGLEAQVVEADLQLQDTTLRAPYEGVIAQRFVEQGQSVRAKQPVVRFQDVQEIEIAVDVPESVMASVVRTSEIVSLAAEFGAAPGQQFPVQVREIAQRADPVTQTFAVRVAMKSPQGINLLPGMTATVSMTYRRAGVLGERIFVPVSALARDSGGEQVAWVVGADGVVSRRPVRSGEISGGEIEIVAGLSPGDRIAVAGASFLREGMKVRDLGDALGGARP